MQQFDDFDFSKFKNSSKWEVVHDEDTQLFYIANANGNKLAGMFTTKRFASKRLYDYLSGLQENNHYKPKEEPVLEEKAIYDLFGKIENTPSETVPDDSNLSKLGIKAIAEA